MRLPVQTARRSKIENGVRKTVELRVTENGIEEMDVDTNVHKSPTRHRVNKSGSCVGGKCGINRRIR